MTTLRIETLGEGLDVILIHGWGMPGLIWHNTARALAKHYRVTTIDLPGYGESEPLDIHTLPSLSEHLLASLPHPAIWVGWSLGGMIAMYLASQYPQHTLGLVTIASSPKFVKDYTWSHGVERVVFTRFERSLKQDYYGTLHRFITLQELGSEHPSTVVRQLRKIIQMAHRPTLETLQAGLGILLDTDLRKEVADIRCPFLQIIGDKDVIVPASAAHYLAWLYPSTQLQIIHGRGHAPFLPTSTQVVNSICAFIDDRIKKQN